MRRFSLLAAAAFLLASSLALALAGDASPLDAAMKALEEGDFAKAVKTANEVPAEDPLWVKAQYVAGEAWLAFGDPDQAAKSFRRALEKKPESAPLLAGLGRALDAKGEHADAESAIRAALKVDPKDTVARRALGECLAAQGKAAEARKELEAAVKADPKEPLANRALVEFFVKQGEAESAGKCAEALVQADAKNAMGYFLRGLVLDKQKKGKEAIEAYEAALAKDDRMLDAHKNLAILCVTDNPLYSNRERTKKAFDHFARYFELGGKDEELKQTYETIKGFLQGSKGTTTPDK